MTKPSHTPLSPILGLLYTHIYYYYIGLTAFFRDNLGKPIPER